MFAQQELDSCWVIFSSIRAYTRCSSDALAHLHVCSTRRTDYSSPSLACKCELKDFHPMRGVRLPHVTYFERERAWTSRYCGTFAPWDVCSTRHPYFSFCAASLAGCWLFTLHVALSWTGRVRRIALAVRTPSLYPPPSPAKARWIFFLSTHYCIPYIMKLHLLNTYDFNFRSKLVPGTFLGSLSLEPTPKLFPEQLWVVSPSSWYSSCSRNNFGSLSIETTPKLFLEQLWLRSPSSRYQSCSRNNFGCALHRVDTKVVPGTTLGWILHWVDTQVVPGTAVGVSSIESTPELFREQLWGAPSIESSLKLFREQLWGEFSIELTAKLFREQLLTQVLLRLHHYWHKL